MLYSAPGAILDIESELGCGAVTRAARTAESPCQVVTVVYNRARRIRHAHQFICKVVAVINRKRTDSCEVSCLGFESGQRVIIVTDNAETIAHCFTIGRSIITKTHTCWNSYARGCAVRDCRHQLPIVVAVRKGLHCTARVGY